jgi:hypothetical protein
MMGTEEEIRLRLQIAKQVAKEEGLDVETVLECWAEFRALPLDVQERFLSEARELDS